MKHKLINLLLIIVLSISTLSGCSSSTASSQSGPADGYDALGGTWFAAAIYYKDKYLIDLSDNDTLMNLYDTTMLIFDENGTFLYTNIFNYRGQYTRNNADSFILTTENVFLYDFEADGMVEKEKEDADKPVYIVNLLDKNTMKINTFDPETNKISESSTPLILEKEDTESQYIKTYKTPLNGGSSSETDSTPNSTDNNNNNYSTKPITTPFTNKYGTATTYCVQNGCNNYIASSGDTNCCTKHSARCLNCNCYIDGDAMYCMSCMSGSAKGSSSSSSSSYSSSSSSADTCKFKYSSGAVCGAKINNYISLCDKHFHELNNIYQSFTN